MDAVSVRQLCFVHMVFGGLRGPIKDKAFEELPGQLSSPSVRAIFSGLASASTVSEIERDEVQGQDPAGSLLHDKNMFPGSRAVRTQTDASSTREASQHRWARTTQSPP